MSFQITTAFQMAYGRNVMILAQQKESRLRNAVTVESGVNGKRHYMDYLGAVSASQITNRHGDSPLNSTPHSRRAINLAGYDTGDLIDKIDKVRVLDDMAGGYTQVHGAAMGRAIDDVIIASFFADAMAGEEGGSTVTFPAGNQIAVNSWAYGTGSGNAGLTVSKLIEAKVFLDGGEASGQDGDYHIACQAKQIGNLLATTETTSADYNNVKALVEGKIDKFMGFTFHRIQRLPVDGSSYRRVPVWHKSGVGLAIGEDVTSRVTERADKRFSWYAYFQMLIGATRLEETKVAEIKCLEV